MSYPGQPPQYPQQPNPFGKPPGAGGYQPGPVGYSPQPVPSGDNTVGMIAMICGLLSLIMGCPLSIAAIILGFAGMKKEPKGMATAGLVLGIVTLTLNVLIGCFVLAFYGLIFGAAATMATVAAAVGPPLNTVTTMQQKAAELEAHKSSNGSYPDEATGSSMIAGTNDGWGHPIVYRLDSDGYILVSPGPDGILDNEDDIPFHAYEYDPTALSGGSLSPADYAYIQNATERSISMAVDLVDNHYQNSTSEYYPTDGEGQALIDRLTDEWGNKLVYRQTEGGDSYLVITKGPDGALDTSDDLNDETYPYAE